MPDKTRMFLLFLAAGAGTLLLYAAYKDKSPTDLLSNYATGSNPSSNPPSTGQNPNSGPPTHGGAQFRNNHHGQSAPMPSGYPSGSFYMPGNVS